MKKKTIALLVAIIAFKALSLSGCWSPLTDYWADTDTQTETDTMTDAGECFEDDTSGCADAGL